MTVLRRGTLAVVLALLCLSIATGCRSPYKGPPGTGTTVADKVYTAAKVQIGQPVFSASPYVETVPMRVDSIGASNPSLAASRRMMGGGMIRYTYGDGSTLTLNAGPDRVSLAAVEIVRP